MTLNGLPPASAPLMALMRPKTPRKGFEPIFRRQAVAKQQHFEHPGGQFWR
jgi:hypothetical protein